MIAGMTDGFIGLQFHFLTSTGPSSMVMPLSYNTPGVPLGFATWAIREIRSGEQLPPIAPPRRRRLQEAPPARLRRCAAGQPAGRAATAPPPPPRLQVRPTTRTASAWSSCSSSPQDDRGTLQSESDHAADRPTGGQRGSSGRCPRRRSPSRRCPGGRSPDSRSLRWRSAAAGPGGAAAGGRPRRSPPPHVERRAVRPAEKLRQEALIPGFTVTIDRPYYIGRYEVTQAEWRR